MIKQRSGLITMGIIWSDIQIIFNIRLFKQACVPIGLGLIKLNACWPTTNPLDNLSELAQDTAPYQDKVKLLGRYSA